MMYIVDSVVCDYGVYEITDNGKQLKVICNSMSNAKLIADILNTDLEHASYKIIRQSQIDKAIEEMTRLFDSTNNIALENRTYDCIQILKRNTGESK